MREVEEWFDALYLEHAPRMRRLAAQILHDEATAEDMVHNVFLLLLSHQEEVRQYTNPAGWMYIVLRNQIGNELQRAERNKVISLDFADCRTLQYEERTNSLMEILPQGLREEERDLLTMFYEERLSHAEIAEKLGCTELACRCKLYRVKKRCEKLLISTAAKKNSECRNISVARSNLLDREVK